MRSDVIIGIILMALILAAVWAGSLVLDGQRQACEAKGGVLVEARNGTPVCAARLP